MILSLLAVPGSLWNSADSGEQGRKRGLRYRVGLRANAPKRNALLVLVYLVVGLYLAGLVLTLL
ncbi:hypothetical protein [Haloarchaeobius amylolyticus]|uniref:hypothetical protein n=1 Tax=Haloarchaeobius amylolyticus TaxID=1198296 RepID=UPI00226FC1F7|nr:hypothetical protein [Haloarchaeobius amylolyticus]